MPTLVGTMSAFDNHWSDALWQKIEANRGTDLSGSIWNIANDAQNQAYHIIRDAEQQGKTFNEVKKELGDLLTAKGKSNMGYNVKRMWVDQVKRNRIVAQRQVWLDMGYVQNIILRRSDHAEPCEICDEEVGEGPGAEKIVPLETTSWPPFHPWCACDARPAKPSAKDIAAFLKGETGSPAVQKLVTVSNQFNDDLDAVERKAARLSNIVMGLNERTTTRKQVVTAVKRVITGLKGLRVGK